MELIKNLGTRKNKIGGGKASYGEFLCPICNKKIETQLGTGKKAKSCNNCKYNLRSINNKGKKFKKTVEYFEEKLFSGEILNKEGLLFWNKKCACGCGFLIKFNIKHKYVRNIPNYLLGHQNKKKPNMLGKTHTEEVRKKIKEANNKRWENIEYRDFWYNKTHTEENKKENSIRSKKRWENEGYREKRSEDTKLLWENTKFREKILNSYPDRSGTNNSQWQDGKSFEIYPQEFKQIRKFILERDGYKCQYPGCMELHNRLHVHHIDYDKKNNNPENLITLGTSCHTKTNPKKKREYFTEFYQNIMMGKLLECLL